MRLGNKWYTFDFFASDGAKKRSQVIFIMKVTQAHEIYKHFDFGEGGDMDTGGGIQQQQGEVRETTRWSLISKEEECADCMNLIIIIAGARILDIHGGSSICIFLELILRL